MGSASTVQFSPTILTQLGWSGSSGNVHAIPLYLVAVVLCIISSYLTVKLKSRAPFILIGCCISIVGWAIQRALAPAGARYFGLFCIYSGSSIQMANLTAWLLNNLRGRSERAVAAAILLGFGNSCNFVSSNVFITHEAPKYPTGFTTGLLRLTQTHQLG